MDPRNLRIGAKLALALGLMTLLTALLGVAAWTQLRAIDAASEEIATNWFPSVQAVGNVRIAANRVRRAESEVTLPQDAAVGDKYVGELQKRDEALAAAEDAYRPLVNAGDEARGFEAYLAQRKRYMEIRATLMGLAKSDREAASQRSSTSPKRRSTA